MNGEFLKFLPLSQGKVAIIDAADLCEVEHLPWRALEKRAGRFYAATFDNGGSTTYLHRILTMESDPTVIIDHINGDGLDCRRNNLRRRTVAENSRAYQTKRAGGSSRYRGVSWVASAGKWRAQLMVNGKSKSIGRFVNELDAARAYDAVALEFGFSPEALNHA